MSANIKATNNSLKDVLKFGCLGLLIGFLITVIIEIQLGYTEITSIRQAFITRLNGDSETQYLLAKAEYSGLNGDTQEVINILLPNINKFSNRFEAAVAYQLLGTAEFQLGHPLLAAGYFELMYANNPTSKNLYTLALAYDGGGNLDKAIEKFAIAISVNDGTMQSQEIAYAQQRIQEIMMIKNPAP